MSKEFPKIKFEPWKPSDSANNPWLSNLVETTREDIPAEYIPDSHHPKDRPFSPRFPILEDEDPRLRLVSQLIEPSNDLKWMCNYMLSTMRLQKPVGVGLAAPQIGYNIRVIVIEPPVKDYAQYKAQRGPIYMVNPEIISRDGEQIVEEGCLSKPGVFRKIKRAKNIKVKWQSPRDDEWITRVFKNFPAAIVQHEIDHLDGKLFTDYTEVE